VAEKFSRSARRTLQARVVQPDHAAHGESATRGKQRKYAAQCYSRSVLPPLAEKRSYAVVWCGECRVKPRKSSEEKQPARPQRMRPSATA